MTEPAKNFIVYKASAGSGKTYTLVKEYLKLVLVNPQKYRHILAVTFTNKAAYEMKSRVITYLKLLSDVADKNVSEKEKEQIRSKNADLIQDLSKATNLDEPELSDRANVVLHKILHNYSDFAISTIDSFVQKIIRTFAYDLKLSQNFEVELDAKRVLSEAVDVILSYAGSDEDITKMLIEFIKQKMDDGKNWEIEKDLKTFSEQLLNENTQKYLDLFAGINLSEFSKAIAASFVRRSALDKEAKQQAASVLTLIKEHQIDSKSFYQGSKGIPGFFQKVAMKGLGAASTNSYCEKAVNEDVWYSKTTPPDEKEKIDEIKDRISTSYKIIFSHVVEFRDLGLIVRSLYPLSLLSQIEKETETIKAEENIIFISDFYRKIHEQLLNEPVPFIYQRAGEKYEHYFIDEFQDTSVLQFQNMLPLIENSMASGNANLIVGDGKQAIYRWRNGEVMQFASLPQLYKKPDLPHFDDIERSVSRNILDYGDYEKGVNNTNFRSKAEIVNFNNGLFDFLSVEVLDENKNKIYQHQAQQAKPGNDGGYVRINFFEAGTDYSDKQLNAILEIIKELTGAGTPLNDIAVICRANQLAADVASHLLQSGIDVVSSESLLLGSSQKVNFIISIFRYLADPDDELAAAFILYFLEHNLKPEFSLNQLILLYQSIKANKPQKYPLNKVFEHFGLALKFENLAAIPLYDLAELLIRAFGFTTPPDPFMVYLLDAVNEFAGDNTPGMQDFLEWWDEKGAGKSIVVPDMLDAVRIMTIHKAKGLEFPIVIYPFADESVKIKDAGTWVDNTFEYCPGIPAFPINISQKALAGTSFENLYLQEKSSADLDMLNICYVALTRPEKQLYILSKKYEKDDGSSFGSLLKKYLKHLGKWSDEDDLYEFGDRSVSMIQHQKADKSNTAIPSTIFSTDWTDKMVIRYNSAIMWEDDETARSISWGNIVHKVLSEIREAADIPEVTAKMVIEGVITDADSGKIREYLDELMLNPKFNRFFGPGLQVLTEAEILTPDNNVYRPDRIIFEEEHNIVIDFKTGAAREDHKTQVRNYARLQTEINGKPCELYLVYLQKEPRVERVDK